MCITAASAAAARLLASAAHAGNKDWPSYNRTLTSDRYVMLSDIDTKNAAHLNKGRMYALDAKDGRIVWEFDMGAERPQRCVEECQGYTGHRPILDLCAILAHGFVLRFRCVPSA
jgi:glucose dehydrogenase